MVCLVSKPKNSAHAKKPTAKSRRSPEQLAKIIENRLVRELTGLEPDELRRAFMLTQWQSGEIDDKTNTVTFAVDVRQLASRHWQLELESQKVTAVHVNLNRITDKENYEYGLMRHVPGTSIWVRTIPITPTYLGAYSFRLITDDDEVIDQPPHTRVRQQVRTAYPDHASVSDISMRSRLDVDEEGRGTKLVSGPLAPNQDHWNRDNHRLHGQVITAYLEDPDLKIFAYLPTNEFSGAAAKKPCRVLTLFDAETWFFKFDLPYVLERAVAHGMEPVAVLGIANRDNAHRVEQLKANPEFLEKVGDIGETWIHNEANQRGMELNPDDNTIAGQSLGGLSALYAGLLNPEKYSTVIAQSPSLWWSPAKGSTPRDLKHPSHGWLIDQFYKTKPKALPHDTNFNIHVGVREGAMVNQAHLLAMTLKAREIPHELHVYDGGHDWGWWRAALLEHLGAQPVKARWADFGAEFGV